MTDPMQRALATVRGRPAELQYQAAELLLALHRLGAEPYRASDSSCALSMKLWPSWSAGS